MKRFTFGNGDQPLPGYTIQRGVGWGGFGEVYFAVSDGGKEVALKLVQRNLEIELRGATQCLNLRHPNLVELFDVQQATDGSCWIVMEYVAGESLADVLERYPQGAPDDCVRAWLEGICLAVAHLHSRGIVHRDLKPANIFLEDNRVKVGDYGLSKLTSASRRSGQTTTIGTVEFMAPEIGNGRYGKEVDLYAIGVILYLLLTGRLPFAGESAAEILMKHLTASPDLSVVPVPFRRVVDQALAKDPAERYASIDALLADLEGQFSGPVVEHAALSAAAEMPGRKTYRAGWDDKVDAHDVRGRILPVVLQQLVDSHVALAKAQPHRVWNRLVFGALGFFAFGCTFLCIAITVLSLADVGMPPEAVIIGSVMYGSVAALGMLGWSRREKSQRERLAGASRRLEDDIQRILTQFPEVADQWGGDLVLRSVHSVRRLMGALAENGHLALPEIPSAARSIPATNVAVPPAGSPFLNVPGKGPRAVQQAEMIVGVRGRARNQLRTLGPFVMQRPHLLIIGCVIACIMISLLANWLHRQNALTPDRPLVVVEQGDSNSIRIYVDEEYFFFSTDMAAIVVAQTNPASELHVEAVPLPPGQSSDGYHDLKLHAARGIGDFTVRATATTFNGRHASTDFAVKVLPHSRATDPTRKLAGEVLH